MKEFFSRDYGFIGETPIRFKKWVMVLLALFAPILAQIVAGFLSIPFLIVYIARKEGFSSLSVLSSPFVLFITVALEILFYFAIVRFIEKRSISTMGFKYSKNSLFEYLMGFIIGIIMISISGFIIVLTGSGQVEYLGLSKAFIPTFIFVIVTWMVQGACEEIMMRGYTLPIIGKLINVPTGILVSSLFFSALHLLNNGITFVSLVNLFLFGVFASFYAIYSGNIWGICALHSAWNFAQGNIWGFSVSGNDIMGETIFRSSYTTENLINGGTFGPEGGLAVTFVLLVGIVGIIILQMKRKNSIREGLK